LWFFGWKEHNIKINKRWWWWFWFCTGAGLGVLMVFVVLLVLMLVLVLVVLEVALFGAYFVDGVVGGADCDGVGSGVVFCDFGFFSWWVLCWWRWWCWLC